MASNIYVSTQTNVLVNTLTSLKIVHLPAISTIATGKIFQIKDICGNASVSSIYISTKGLDMIENTSRASFVYGVLSTNNANIMLASDGVLNWMVLQHYTGNVVRRPFLPTQFTGVQLWLDAADTTTFILSGSSVTRWNDKSLNANYFTSQNTNGSQTMNPSLVGGNSVYFNQTTRNGLLYNNVTQGLQGNMTLNLSTGYHTAFFVGRQDSGTSGFQAGLRITKGSHTAIPNSFFAFDFGPNGSEDALDYNGSAWARDLLFTSNYEANTSNLYIHYTDSTGGTLYKNGTVGQTINASYTTAYTYQVQQVSLGGGYDNRSYAGYVNEVIYYDRALTTAQRQQVEGYLAWKWGLQSKLPSNHPYKNGPP